MVTQMAHSGRRNNLSMIVFGFTCLGLLLAASVTTIFYFGGEYLDQRGGSLASGQTLETETALPTPQNPVSENSTPQQGQVEKMLGDLSAEELSTVQQMLAERAAKEADAIKIDTPSNNPELENPISESPSVNLAQIQDRVDGYSVQGIRKAGKDTRVFLNGKIRRIGETIDLEIDLRLVGFTEDHLLFRTPDGTGFKKAL